MYIFEGIMRLESLDRFLRTRSVIIELGRKREKKRKKIEQLVYLAKRKGKLRERGDENGGEARSHDLPLGKN